MAVLVVAAWKNLPVPVEIIGISTQYLLYRLTTLKNLNN